MEVSFVDAATGDVASAEVGDFDTFEDIYREAAGHFGYEADSIVLYVGVVPMRGVFREELVRGSSLESGSTIEVWLDTQSCVERIAKGKRMSDMPPWVTGNPDCVYAAVSRDGKELQHASQELRDCARIVLAAVQQCGVSLRYASASLRANRDFILTAVKLDGLCILHAAPELRRDHHVALAALTDAPTSATLYGIGEELMSERAFVMEAVRIKGCFLKRASEELRADRGVVLAAVKTGDALKYAGEGLRCDREVVLRAVKTCGAALASACEGMKGDHEVVLAAVRQDHYSLLFTLPSMRDDRIFMRAAVQVNGSSLAFAGSALREDEDLVFDAVMQAPAALQYASEEIRESVMSRVSEAQAAAAENSVADGWAEGI